MRGRRPTATLTVTTGLAAMLLGCGGSKSSSTTTGQTRADPRPITLPASVAGFRDLVDALSSRRYSARLVRQERVNQGKIGSATEAAYRQAFNGAGAAYRAYSDSGLQKRPYVIAVRASAPGVTIGPVLDPSYLGLAKPPRQVMTVGQVSCQISWTPLILAGHAPDPSSEQVIGCQRSGPGLTVFVGGNGFTGPADLQAMVNLTNSAWSAIGGG